jgi:hypothetical protein
MMQGMHSDMIDLIHCKHFCKCYNVPSPSKIKEQVNKIKKVIKIDLDLKVYYEKMIKNLCAEKRTQVTDGKV